ncbi:MAG: hypothetical protein U0T56_02465 [Ferruginibacter sp.]
MPLSEVRDHSGLDTDRQYDVQPDRDYVGTSTCPCSAGRACMNRWYVEANYLFGLGNINNEVRRQDKRVIQNRSIGLHVGYYFRHARKS